MTILFKQTTGIILAIIFILYKIVEIKKTGEMKEFFKIFGTRLLGILIPILIFVIYLFVSNSFIDFIDYAILGIKTFSNTVPYTRLLEEKLYIAYIMPISIVIFIFIYIFTLVNKKFKSKTWAKNIRILLIYDIASAVIIYPIADKGHFAIGSICTILTIVYSIYELAKYILNIKAEKKLIFILKTFIETVSILLFTIYLLKSTISLVRYVKEAKEQTYLKHFKYIYTDENLQKRINAVDEYMLWEEKNGKKVYILDTMAAVFVIPTDRYNKNYDMFNLGNLGSKGESRNNRRFRK